MSSDINKTIALDKELYNAVRLIRAGLGQLQSLDRINDFYHLPILSLASGFERLMKVILCFRAYEVTGEYPTPAHIPKSHDLELLLNKIKSECNLENCRGNLSIVWNDLAFAESNESASFLKILSDFGQWARYYDLDAVLGKPTQAEDPAHRWEALESSVIKDREDLMVEIKASSSTNRHIEEANKIVVSKLERFARALAYLFVKDCIGTEAKRHSSYVDWFFNLSDEQLGKTSYDSCGRDPSTEMNRRIW